jgi:hypothetical protein
MHTETNERGKVFSMAKSTNDSVGAISIGSTILFCDLQPNKNTAAAKNNAFFIAI